MRLHGTDLTRTDLARRADPVAAGGVRLVELADGAERGIRALEFRTGTGLSFEVLVDRAMDLGSAEHAGRSLGWHSPTGTRHPALHEPETEHGLGLLRAFSGLLVSCGLDHILAGGEFDASQFAGDPVTVQPFHGRLPGLPARLTGYGESWTSEHQCVLWAEGTVRQARISAENLHLTRRYEAELGGNEIRLTDVVTNHGFLPAPHMLLYHVNFGWPLLAAGSRLVAPIAGTSFAELGSARVSHEEFPGPLPGFVDQVYEHELRADPAGMLRAAILNDRLELGVELEWPASELPCFLQWLHLREGEYVVALEPATHHIGGDRAAREDGSMIWLAPGESRSYHLTFRVLVGPDALAGARTRVGR
jgi:hypothetical protein